MYKLKKVTVLAFVIGAMGAASDLFEKYTGKLNVTIRLEMIQKAALLGTAGLLRKFWLCMGSNLRTVFGTSGTRLLLAPKGNLPGNGNLLSLRFHNIIIIIIIIIIIVDASNTFNSLNRAAALNNIRDAMPIDCHLCNQHLSSSYAPFGGCW